MKLLLKKNETTVIIHVFIQDSSSTVGAGLTGLTFETGSLVAYYVKPGGTLTSLTLETISTLGTYQAPTSSAHMRFKLMHDTNAPGLYEIHLHTDTLATNDYITIMMHGAANMAPLLLEIQLTDFDLNTATQKVDVETIKTRAITCGAAVTVRADVGAAAAPGAANGMFIGGTNAATTVASLSVTGQLDAGNLLIDGTTVLAGVATLNSVVITGAAIGLSVSGTTAGVHIDGGTTGIGLTVAGGSTSGKAVEVSTVNGDGIDVSASGTLKKAVKLVGSGIGLYAEGASQGIFAYSTGTAGSALRCTSVGSASSGVLVVGTTYDIQSDITGNLSGSVGSVTDGLTTANVNVAAGVIESNLKQINGVATNLNELMDAADTDKIVNNSVLAKMTSKSATADWTSFVNTTDSQEAIADSIVAVKAETALIVEDTGELQTNQGNWVTATGFATPTNITAGTITTVTTLTGHTPQTGDGYKLLAADTEIDLTTDPTQGQLIYKDAGTADVLLTKDLFKPDGTAVTTTSDLIAKEVQA